MEDSRSTETARTCGDPTTMTLILLCGEYSFIKNVGPNLPHQVIDYSLLVTGFVSILLIQSPCNMRVIVFLPSFLIGASFTKAPSGLGNQLA